MSSENRSSSMSSSLLEEEFSKSKALKESVISHFDHSKFSVMNKAPHTQTFVFEFLAMFLFTYGYSCSISITEVDVQAAGSLFLAMALTGPVCGANVNPVITIANFLKRENKYQGRKVLVYLAAQVLGALAGLFWSGFLGHKQLSTMELEGGMATFRVISNEAMGVFFFVLFMLMLSNPNTTFIDDELSGYASIVIFYHIARSFAPLAGLVINPAVTLASAIRYATKGQVGPIANCWAWLFGDFVGVILACFFYEQLFEPIVRTIRVIKRKSEPSGSFFEENDDEDISHKHILDEPRP